MQTIDLRGISCPTGFVNIDGHKLVGLTQTGGGHFILELVKVGE